MKKLIYGAVLAGGLSSRMGRDKRFLQIDGEFLVDRALRLVGEAIGGSSEHVYLCGDVPGRKCLRDFISGIGPVGGILSAIQRVRAAKNEDTESQTPWLLVVPVDMPLLNQRVLTNLVNAIESNYFGNSTAIAYNGFEMPFMIRCDQHTAMLVEATCRIERPSLRSVRALFNKMGAASLNLDHALRELMLNTNSPVDWVRTGAGGLT